MQNAFLASLKQNGVRCYLSGHDHVHHRSLVSQSRRPRHGAANRLRFGQPQVLHAEGAVFGPRGSVVAGTREGRLLPLHGRRSPRHGALLLDGPVWRAPAKPQWSLRETFGYSLNGKEFLVKKGQPYTSVSDSIAAGSGYAGTKMSILSGSNETTGKTVDGRDLARLVTTGWAPKAESLASDVLSLWGMHKELGSKQTDTFVLSMSFNPGGLGADVLKSGNFGLLAQDAAGKWALAVGGNQGGAKQFVAGPWKAGYGLGTYGVDQATGTAWAVVNHDGDFAVGKP